MNLRSRLQSSQRIKRFKVYELVRVGVKQMLWFMLWFLLEFSRKLVTLMYIVYSYNIHKTNILFIFCCWCWVKLVLNRIIFLSVPTNMRTVGLSLSKLLLCLSFDDPTYQHGTLSQTELKTKFRTTKLRNKSLDEES